MTEKATTPTASLREDAIYTPRFDGDKRPRVQLMFSCFNACGVRFMDGVHHEAYYNKYLDCLRICIVRFCALFVPASLLAHQIVADSSPGMNFKEVVKMIGADDHGKAARGTLNN